jgi:S-formylglutathione hydrolase FrmB
MKRIAACAAALALALVAAPIAQANVARIVEEKRVSDRLIELTIETSAFTAPTKVHVFLPTGYGDDRKRRWPVTYLTAGTMNNYNSFQKVLRGEELTTEYESIIVSPDGNSGYWSDWFNAGAFGPPQYETYVIDQLIPLIDGRFRTAARRSQRAVSGVSMGGYGAMMYAARHPDLFVAAASLSGAVDSNLPTTGAALSASSTFDGGPPDAIYGPRASEEVRWRGHNPVDLATNLRDVDLQVRTANGVPNPGIGEGEGSGDLASCVVEGGVYGASVSFHETLDELGVSHLWQDYGPGCHTVPNFTRQTVDSLAVFERVFADPPPRPRKFEYSSIEPRFSVYGWTVATDPGRALEFMRMTDVSRGGLTLTGSGTTRVTTPRWFRQARSVRVSTAAGTERIEPNRRGRLRFTVDLGPPHRSQQFTAGADDAFATQVVSLRPRVE